MQGGPTLVGEKKKSPGYIDRHSPIDLGNDRGAAEEELLKLSSQETPTTILNLPGLWGGPRSMRRYVSRIAGTKDQLRNKGSIHMMHGIDVARAILATSQAGNEVYGQRWLLTGMPEFLRCNRSKLIRMQICECTTGMTWHRSLATQASMA
jgi:nucleoside-diphosphate-sugar epimerase